MSRHNSTRQRQKSLLQSLMQSKLKKMTSSDPFSTAGTLSGPTRTYKFPNFTLTCLQSWMSISRYINSSIINQLRDWRNIFELTQKRPGCRVEQNWNASTCKWTINFEFDFEKFLLTKIFSLIFNRISFGQNMQVIFILLWSIVSCSIWKSSGNKPHLSVARDF